MVFDIYLPSLNLIVEYHGLQHYHDTPMYGHAKLRQQRDTERRDYCKSMGTTLVEIPYWWQSDKGSIVALLHKFRPDIFSPEIN